MLEKGGAIYVVGIFPDGLVFSPNLLKYMYIFSFVVLSMSLENISLGNISLGIPQIPISPCHTLSTTGRYGLFVRDM